MLHNWGVNRCWILTALLLWPLAAVTADDPASRHFVDRVKPLLESRCISCHGPDKVKGGLRLDSRAAALKGGENGPALVPGKPSESLLLKAVMHTKPELEMPPKEKLTTNDIAVLERWISDGAPWPEKKLVASAPKLAPGERLGNAWSDPRNPIVRIFGGQQLDLWSLKPIRRTDPPKVRNVRWVRNGIDRFVLVRLEAAGLTPSPEADRRTLARRLYFDLTGLPPTPEEMERFLCDTSPDAYERLVDELLGSRHYGEHWARQWLDVIRYSDSNGFDWDEFRPRAWRFRDYVIRSLNSDKSFDQFVREQLAGDELLSGPPRNEMEQDDLIATGYLRLGPHDNSAAAFNEQARSRAELMADLTETTSAAFLGLTMACCRCHDHKYDPLSQVDHYRLRAFFEPVKFADDLPLDAATDQQRIRKQNEGIDSQIKPWQEKRDALLAQVKLRLREERVAKLSPEERELLNRGTNSAVAASSATLVVSSAGGTNALLNAQASAASLEALRKNIEPSDKQVMAALNKEEKARHADLLNKIDALKKEKLSFTLGLLMVDAEEKPPVTKILFQGNHKDEREPVEPGFISALDPNPAPIRKPTNAKSTGRRLTLSDWIVAPENPLTTRVLVNRVWQSHFGRGLVSTPNDFGLAGARPSHPELLDWLATEFVRQGWSLKKLHRLIVTSATYRQSSSIRARPRPSSSIAETFEHEDEGRGRGRVDSGNHLLWRQNIRRLSAEQLRDSLLAVSGTLIDRTGGPPIWPELPPEVLQANPAFLDDNAEKTKGWYPSPPRERTVRSIYLVQKRTVRIPFMETFDLPENATSCPRRNESTVAPQALSLLNSSLSIEAARAMAVRVQRDTGSERIGQVDRAYSLALQRSPTSDERRACLEFLNHHALAELCRALLNLNEFVYVD